MPETVTSMEESEGVDKERGFTLVGKGGERTGGKEKWRSRLHN